jgi:hypothetical protein
MFGIGMGPSSQEKSQYNALNASSGFATNLGESDLSKSSSFFSTILSGNQSKIAQLLSPQTNAMKQQAGERKASTSQFNTRSGGTAASGQAIDTQTLGSVNQMIASLMGTSASNLASSGSSALGMGMQGQESAFGEAKTMQQQSSAQMNDIFKSASSIAGSVMGGIGNLDTTGGSTTGEQVKNFFSGAS